MAIVRRYLVDKIPVSDLCDEYGLNPTVFYRWQKEFFENGTAAFERRGDGREPELEEKVAVMQRRSSKYREGAWSASSRIRVGPWELIPFKLGSQVERGQSANHVGFGCGPIWRDAAPRKPE